MNIRRIVPAKAFIGPHHGDTAVKKQLQTHPPVAVILKRHDGVLADPNQMRDHLPRVAGRLKRPGQHNKIERIVRIVFKIGVRIPLNDRKAVRHARIHARLAEFDTAAIDTLVPTQMVEQGAIAATDIQHTAAVRDHFRNQFQIAARQGAHGSALGAHFRARPR